MSLAVILTRQANADLREIWRYTYAAWGAAQADRYLDQIDAAIARCAAQPMSGRNRDELRAVYRSVRCGRHVVFYTVADSELVVQRVLHGRMDLPRRIDRD